MSILEKHARPLGTGHMSCVSLMVKELKALVNIVVDRLKKNRTVLADLYNYVQVDE